LAILGTEVCFNAKSRLTEFIRGSCESAFIISFISKLFMVDIVIQTNLLLKLAREFGANQVHLESHTWIAIEIPPPALSDITAPSGLRAGREGAQAILLIVAIADSPIAPCIMNLC